MSRVISSHLRPFFFLCLPIFLEAMVFSRKPEFSPTPEPPERKTILFTGWQFQKPAHVQSDTLFPKTDNYYFRIKPESVVEIIMDPLEEEDVPLGPAIEEHTSITTSVSSHGEYKTSCAKEPGCRWECEPRQDELPPDCDCVCFYTDAKWDKMP